MVSGDELEFRDRLQIDGDRAHLSRACGWVSESKVRIDSGLVPKKVEPHGLFKSRPGKNRVEGCRRGTAYSRVFRRHGRRRPVVSRLCSEPGRRSKIHRHDMAGSGPTAAMRPRRTRAGRQTAGPRRWDRRQHDQRAGRWPFRRRPNAGGKWGQAAGARRAMRRHPVIGWAVPSRKKRMTAGFRGCRRIQCPGQLLALGGG